MYLTKKIKEDIFKKHGKESKNTGSAEGQIALFTYRINHLTEHLKKNRKDFNTVLRPIPSTNSWNNSINIIKVFIFIIYCRLFFLNN